jgi:hypothetical protein
MKNKVKFDIWNYHYLTPVPCLHYISGQLLRLLSKQSAKISLSGAHSFFVCICADNRISGSVNVGIAHPSIPMAVCF